MVRNSNLKKQNKNPAATKKSVQIQSMTSTYSGPIPPPEILIKYNEATPNAADRILVLTENQQGHRLFIEKQVIKKELSQSRFGQIFAFILGVLGLGLGAYIIIQGHDWAGTTLSGGTLVSLVYAFLQGTKGQQKNLDKKIPN